MLEEATLGTEISVMIKGKQTTTRFSIVLLKATCCFNKNHSSVGELELTSEACGGCSCVVLGGTWTASSFHKLMATTGLSSNNSVFVQVYNTHTYVNAYITT